MSTHILITGVPRSVKIKDNCLNQKVQITPAATSSTKQNSKNNNNNNNKAKEKNCQQWT